MKRTVFLLMTLGTIINVQAQTNISAQLSNYNRKTPLMGLNANAIYYNTWNNAALVDALDETLTRATLGIVRSQLDELISREARLLAERDGEDQIRFPDGLIGRRTEAAVAAAIAGEEKLFESRRVSRTGQSSQLRERVAQVNEEIRGLTAQLAAKESEIKFIAEELAGVADLYKRNLVTIVRYNQLQRDDARLQGERGQLIADRARARSEERRVGKECRSRWSPYH